MKSRNRYVGVGVVALSLMGILVLRGKPSVAPPPPQAEPAPALAVAPAPMPAAAPPAAVPAGNAVEPQAAAPAPSPSAIKLVANSRELYEEMSSVIEYYKQKPLPEHGPVHKVGDGVDSSDRNTKLAPDTPFSRFRYEYEKLTSARLMDDLAWTDKELAQLRYEERSAKNTLAGDDKAAADLLLRRRRAIVSILDQRAREEQAHDRYQRVQVEFQDPNAQPAPEGGG